MTTPTLTVLPPRWRLQSFEQELALLEAQALSRGRGQRDGGTIRIDAASEGDAELLADRLSFARAIVVGSRTLPTRQHRLEVAAGGGGHKTTSHALHGLHPYKGKFYPQLARSLLNVAHVGAGSVVLDPFAGCGTTLLEAAMAGAQGIGLDLNPMAVLVSDTKLQLLHVTSANLRRDLRYVRRRHEVGSLPDETYLERWFPEENLRFLRQVMGALSHAPNPLAARAVQVVLSSVLRAGSYQDPRQLRVGRRKDDPSPLAPLFWRALDDLLAEIEALEEAGLAPIGKCGRSFALTGDARTMVPTLNGLGVRAVDAVITSPPYASALPYIDTDRLSLRLFGLLEASSQRDVECRLIGNREITEKEREAYDAVLTSSDGLPAWVPMPLQRLLDRSLAAAREPTAGFRKRRTPGLLYAYFRDMRVVIAQVAMVLRPGGPFVLVVGDNTVAGPGGTFEVVPTADLCVTLAEQAGFALVGDFSKRLTSYGAPETVHQRNAMDSERVLLFEHRGRSGSWTRDPRADRADPQPRPDPL